MSAASKRSISHRPGWLAVLSLVASSSLLGACGGSSSETPYPQSPSEMTSEPLLRRSGSPVRSKNALGTEPRPSAEPQQPGPSDQER